MRELRRPFSAGEREQAGLVLDQPAALVVQVECVLRRGDQLFADQFGHLFEDQLVDLENLYRPMETRRIHDCLDDQNQRKLSAYRDRRPTLDLSVEVDEVPFACRGPPGAAAALVAAE